jgi:hypothetical protein
MDLRTALLAAAKASPEPLTAAQLKKRAQVPAKPAALKVLLDDLAQAGLLRVFTSGKSNAYCAGDPLELSLKALAAIAANLKGSSTPASLKAKLPKTLRPWFDEAAARLVVKGQLWWHISGKTRLLSRTPPRPSDLLSKTQTAALEKLLMQVNQSRRTPRTLTELRAWLDDEAPAGVSITRAPVTTTEAALTAEQLLEWYAADRARSSSSMIPIPQTWLRHAAWAQAQDLQPSPDTFRTLLKSLYDEGRIILEPCERPQDLPDEERSLQVPMAFGPPGYYWSVL